MDASATTLDWVHASMLLQAGGQANALRMLIKIEQAHGPDFIRLASALSELYSKALRKKDYWMLCSWLHQGRSLYVKKEHLCSEGDFMGMFDRITFDPKITGGRACIRGMRIPVSVIVGQIAHGATTEEVLADYPDLVPADIRQALECAAWLAQEEVSIV